MSKQSKTPAPTFATLTTKLDELDSRDLCDGELATCARQWLADFDEWRRITNDHTEAEARAEYARHTARHLVEVFPNARVGVATYAEAMGEDIADYSADVIRLVAKRWRATRKSLPTIADMREGCEAEARERWKWRNHFSGAIAAHEASIQKGQEQAARWAADMAKHGATITAAEILHFYDSVMLYPLGIDQPDYRKQEAAQLKSVFRTAATGAASARDWIAAAMVEASAAEQRVTELGAEAYPEGRQGDEAAKDKYHAACGEMDALHRRLIGELPAILAAPRNGG